MNSSLGLAQPQRIPPVMYCKKRQLSEAMQCSIRDDIPPSYHCSHNSDRNVFSTNSGLFSRDFLLVSSQACTAWAHPTPSLGQALYISCGKKSSSHFIPLQLSTPIRFSSIWVRIQKSKDGTTHASCSSSWGWGSRRAAL